MSHEMNLNEWLVAFEANKDKNDKSTACELGFFDWFCRDSALMNKIRKMAPMVKRVINSGKVNNEKCYVFFKNNCPLSGPTYDSFSICNIETMDVIYWIEPKAGTVYDGRTNSYIIEDNPKAMREFFQPTKKEQKEMDKKFSDKFMENVTALETEPMMVERFNALVENQEEDEFTIKDIVFVDAEPNENGTIIAKFAVVYETEANGEIGLEIPMPVTPEGKLAA